MFYFIRAIAVSLCAALITPAVTWADQSYRLSAGDTLSFSVVQFPELTREVAVGVDGAVFLPLIGLVEAQDLTVHELRAVIWNRLRESPIRMTDPQGADVWHDFRRHEVVIDILAYRPVYVTGAIREPGELPFRPGLTARQAIARAGGIGLTTGFDDLRLLEMEVRRTGYADEIAVRETRVDRLRADLERLAGGGGGEPVAAEGSSDEPSLERVGEDWLTLRETLRRSERENQADELRDMYERLDVLQELQAVSDETVRVQEGEVERAVRLRERGIATENVLSDARQDLLQASSRALDTANELLRLRADITEAESELATEEMAERITLLEEIEAELAEILRLRNTYTSLSRGMLQVDPEAEQVGDELRVLVHRSGADGPSVMDPDEPLMPGDVVDVVLVEGTTTDARVDLR